MRKIIESKQKQVDELASKLESCQSFLVFEYLGLNANEISLLRKKLLADDAKLYVIKNNITNRAIKKLGYDSNFGSLVNANAVLICNGDEIKPLKHISDLMKNNQFIKIKGSVILKTYYDEQLSIKIASLPSREAMYAMFLSCLNSPIRSLLYGLKAIVESKSE